MGYARILLGPLVFTLYTSPLFKLVKEHLHNIHCFPLARQRHACQTSVSGSLPTKSSSMSQRRNFRSSELDSSFLRSLQMAFPLETQRWRLLKRSRILVSGWTILCLCPNMSSNLHPPASFPIQPQAYQEISIQERLRNSNQRIGCISTRLLQQPFLRPSCQTSLTTPTCPKQCNQTHPPVNAVFSIISYTRFHWLPIKYRCIFKILLIAFKAIHGHAPSYIQDLVKVKHQTRTLRSSTATYLDHSSIKSSNNLGKRCFYIAAPTEWNPLLANIRNSPSYDVFPKSLKTHLSIKAFDT